MDKFLKQYLITALWSNELDGKYEIENFDEDSLSNAKKDCDNFKEKAGDILDRYNIETCGHDFWLTRNGHGAGFWDGDYGKEDGEILTNLSKEFGEVNLVEGDNKQLFII